jgi:superfamily I DNA/RNA helicase
MYKPTEEQEIALEAFSTGESIKVNAFAGTGKTTTLQMMSEKTMNKGLYLAFNKSIANEAGKRFPHTVKATTSHGLAFRHIIQNGFTAEKMTGKLNVNAIAEYLKLSYLTINENITLTPRQYAYLISETVRRFTHSSNTSITIENVPIFGNLIEVKKDDMDEMKKAIAIQSNILWSRMISPNDIGIYLGHDGYLKLWTLSSPQLKTDFIFLDEAQDSTPALLNILQIQKSQIVYVGDRFQQIYEWRGATNGMNSISVKKEVQLTQSFRFGDAIAHYNSKILKLLDPNINIKGNSSIASVIGCSNPDTILTRTNASLIGYILAALEAGRKPHVIGGTQELVWMLKDVSLLKDNLPGTHPEFFGFKNWSQVKEFSAQKEGQALHRFVKIVDNYGERILLVALERTCVFEDQADLIISTTHRAKGREWSHVMVDDDFVQPLEAYENNSSEKKFSHSDGKEYYLAEEEIRLLYVASTRGSIELQIPTWCTNFFNETQITSKLQLLPKPKTNNIIKKIITHDAENLIENKINTNAVEKNNRWMIYAIGILLLVIIFIKK